MDPSIWVLAAIAFLPAFAFLLWVRAREKHGREPFGPVIGTFVYGATLGVLVAIILGVGLGSFAGGSLLIAAVIIAPIVEEPCKAVGLRFVRAHIDEVEDGLVYGIVVGLGFAATETFLYGLLESRANGYASAIVVESARVFSSLLLHACTSGLLGFAYARHRVQGAPWGVVLGAYGVAAALHALYNGLVVLMDWVGFLAAIVMVVVIMGVLLRKVRDLDRGVPA